MDQAFYTIALDELVDSAIKPQTFDNREERRELRGQWLDRDGLPVGDPYAIPIEPAQAIEGFGADGPDWQPVADTIRLDPPQETSEVTSLQLFDGVRPIKRIALSSISRFETLAPPRLTARFGDPGASRELRVFSERFTDFDRFEDAVARLQRHLLTRRPFDEADVRAKLSMRGYYWPSDRDSGMFNTPDRADRLFYGDRKAAWTLLYPHLQRDLPGIILIDSVNGGGAGGSKATDTAPGHLAWASIAEIADYPWGDVALHEIGHAFGLADEYVSDSALDYSIYTFDGQPNISPTRDRQAMAWAPRLTTAKHGRGVDSEADFKGQARRRVIGAFEGAFYRDDWIRPSPDCLMRALGHDFCPECAATLREKLTNLH